MWLLAVLILLMPFEMNPYLYISPNFLGLLPDFTLIKLVGMMALVWVAVRSITTKSKLGLWSSRQAKCFFAFVFVVVLAGLLNGAAIRPLSRLISIINLLPLLLASVRTQKDLVFVLQVTAVSLVVIFPYGVRQTLRFGGRYGVGLYEPNYLAIAIVLVIPLTVVLARHAKTRLRRLLWASGVLILLFSAMFTGSRGGFIGLVVAAVFFVLKLTRRPMLSLVGVSLLLGVFLFIIPNPLLDRLRATRDPEAYGDAGIKRSNDARMSELIGGLRMIRARPLTGVGLGNFKSWMRGYDDLEIAAIAHNTYMEIGAELGLPALGIYLLVLLAAYRSLSVSARRAFRSGSDLLRDVALSFQVGLIGYAVAAVFLSAEFEKYLWLFLFMSICIERVSAAYAAQRKSEASVTPQRVTARDTPRPAYVARRAPSRISRAR